MLKRRWPWFGKLISDEGFEISYGHKSVYYQDRRGKFEFGYEDGNLRAMPYQVKGERIALTDSDIDQMVERVVSGIEADGHKVVQIYRR